MQKKEKKYLVTISILLILSFFIYWGVFAYMKGGASDMFTKQSLRDNLVQILLLTAITSIHPIFSYFKNFRNK